MRYHLSMNWCGWTPADLNWSQRLQWTEGHAANRLTVSVSWGRCCYSAAIHWHNLQNENYIWKLSCSGREYRNDCNTVSSVSTISMKNKTAMWLTSLKSQLQPWFSKLPCTIHLPVTVISSETFTGVSLMRLDRWEICVLQTMGHKWLNKWTLSSWNLFIGLSVPWLHCLFFRLGLW